MRLTEFCPTPIDQCKDKVNIIRTRLYEMYNAEMDDDILREMIVEYDNVLFNGLIHRKVDITCSWDDSQYFIGEFSDASGLTGRIDGRLHIAINGKKFEEFHVSLTHLFETIELQLVFCMQSITRGRMEIDAEFKEALSQWFDTNETEHDFW